MTTYNTGNPVPSADARDRYDNSQTLDEVVNGDSASYTTRTGKQVISLGGMNSRFNNAQDARDVEFDLSQTERDDVFQTFLEGTGWSSLGAYGAGVVITSHTQTVDYLGQPYSLKPSIPASLDAPYVTTGVWATEGVNFKLVGDNSLRQDLATPTGAELVYFKNRSLEQKLLDFVCVNDFYLSSDGTDWSKPYARALAESPRVRFPYRADITYIIPTPLNMADGGALVVDPGVTLYSPAAVDAAGANMATILNVSGKSRIAVIGARFDGGVREVQTAKSFTRPVRVINCTNVAFIGCEIVNNPDWSLSFEGCDGVLVDRYKQRSYVYADPAMTIARAGGRDGLHFMDCSNVFTDVMDIESGDDCVGITSKDTGGTNINISNVQGSSVSASLVIYNEEMVGGAYVAKPMIGLKIKDVHVKKGGTARNVVRALKYNPLSTLEGVTISGVSGEGSSHGVWVGGVNKYHLDDIDVVSTIQHGVYLQDCIGGTGTARGKSRAIGFDGVNMAGGSDNKLTLLSTGAANYGIQLLNLVSSVIVPIARDCGAGNFSANSGGNMRMANCDGVEIPNGVLSGSSAISHYGLIEAGNTNCRVGRGVKISGLIPRFGAQNPISVYQEPTVAVRFSESGGAITVSSALGCTVELVSSGVYKVKFTVPMRSTLFNFQISATAVGLVRMVKLLSSPTVNEINFSTVNASDVVGASVVSFLAYDS